MRRQGVKPLPGPHLIYASGPAHTEAIVEPIHTNAMLAILTTDEERDLRMQRHGTRGVSLAAATAGSSKIVVRGADKEERAAVA